MSQLFAKNTFKIDHIFTLVEEQDIDDEVLLKHGLTVTTHYRPHKGQGTAGRFLFFNNMYLEFLYIDNEDEARKNSPNIGTNLSRRAQWKKQPAFPYGMALSLTDEKYRQSEAFKEQFHIYDTVEWMQDLPPILVDKYANQTEQPMHFLLADVMYYERFAGKNHPSYGKDMTSLDKVVTKVKLHIPGRAENYQRIFDFQRSIESSIDYQIQDQTQEWLLEIVCDHHQSKNTVDLRPNIPLMIHY